MDTKELIEELEAFDPKYRDRYPTLRDAAKAAGILPEFTKWLASPDGKRYLEVASAHNHVEDNRMRRLQVDAELQMAQRGAAQARRGHLVDGDTI